MSLPKFQPETITITEPDVAIIEAYHIKATRDGEGGTIIGEATYPATDAVQTIPIGNNGFFIPTADGESVNITVSEIPKAGRGAETAPVALATNPVSVVQLPSGPTDIVVG
jgi:hypothetical protein